MTLGTVIQSDYIFIDQLACLSAKQTSGSDSPEEIQDSSRDSTDGCTGNPQCASRTSAANHTDNHGGSSSGNSSSGSNRASPVKRVRN